MSQSHLASFWHKDDGILPTMSSAVKADRSSVKDLKQREGVDQADVMDPNHDNHLPVQSVDDSQNHNAREKDDAATMAASEELKHTTISDNIASIVKPSTEQFDPAGAAEDMKETVKESTPEPEPTDTQDEEMKEKLSSPKKKRGRDTYDESKELEGENVVEAGSSADLSAVNGSRLEREGPEKKRHRDTSEDPLKVVENPAEAKVGVFLSIQRIHAC